MTMLRFVFVAVAVAALSGCTEPEATGLQAVSNAMGATNLNSIQYSGGGSVLGFGQAFEPGERWPRFDQRLYRRQPLFKSHAVDLRIRGALLRLCRLPPYGRAQQNEPAPAPHGRAAVSSFVSCGTFKPAAPNALCR